MTWMSVKNAGESKEGIIIFHSHTGGGSLRSMRRPRRTCPRNDVVAAEASSTMGGAAGGEGPTLTGQHRSLRRKSPSRSRVEEEEVEVEGVGQVAGPAAEEETLRSRTAAAEGSGGGKLVLALEPRRDLAAPS